VFENDVLTKRIYIMAFGRILSFIMAEIQFSLQETKVPPYDTHARPECDDLSARRARPRYGRRLGGDEVGAEVRPG
jgi:hypothetical protein